MAATLVAQVLAQPADGFGGTIPYLIALHLASVADDEGKATVRQRDVAAHLALSERTVRRAYDVLSDLGMVEIAAIVCRINLDRLAGRPDSQSKPDSQSAGHVGRSTGLTVRRTHSPPVTLAGRPDSVAAQPDSLAGGPVTLAGLGGRGDSNSSLLSPHQGEREEGEKVESNARAGEAATAPRAAPELERLAWVEAARLPLRLGNGVDLSDQWLRVLQWLSPDERDEIRTAMQGDLPQHFADATTTCDLDQRRADRKRKAIAIRDNVAQEIERIRRADARAAAQVAADADHAARAATQAAAHAENQPEAERLLAIATPAWREGASARLILWLHYLHAAHTSKTVSALHLREVRAMAAEHEAARAKRAAEPAPQPPPNPGHPAALDRDHPMVVLDDDAPPIAEDPVCAAIREHLERIDAPVGTDAIDAWLEHLVEAGAAMTSGDADAYLALATRIASQRGIVVASPSDVPSAAMIAWAGMAEPVAP